MPGVGRTVGRGLRWTADMVVALIAVGIWFVIIGWLWHYLPTCPVDPDCGAPICGLFRSEECHQFLGQEFSQTDFILGGPGLVGLLVGLVVGWAFDVWMWAVEEVTGVDLD